jgi:hypothetical protein
MLSTLPQMSTPLELPHSLSSLPTSLPSLLKLPFFLLLFFVGGSKTIHIEQ